MGLDVFVDCGCVSRGRVVLPEVWRGRTKLVEGAPKLINEWVEWTEDVELWTWYRNSCAHQRAACEIGWSYMKLVRDLGDQFGEERLPHLSRIFDKTNGVGPVIEPERSRGIVEELDMIARTSLTGPPAPRLIEESTGRVLAWRLTGGQFFGDCRANNYRDELKLDFDGVEFSRVHQGLEAAYCNQRFRTRRFEQVRMGDAEYMIRNCGSGEDVRTRIVVPDELIKGHVPRIVRWELHTPTAEEVCRPLRTVCAGAAAEGTDIQGSW